MRGPHLATIGEPHVGQQPSPPLNASRRSPSTIATCSFDPSLRNQTIAPGGNDTNFLKRGAGASFTSNERPIQAPFARKPPFRFPSISANLGFRGYVRFREAARGVRM